MTYVQIQALFPHRCAHAGCAICAWVEAHAGQSPELQTRNMSTRGAREKDIEFATCQRCGEPRIPGNNGLLPPHRCAA